MTRCSVKGCQNYATCPFPTDVDVLRKWLKAMKREDYCPKKNSKICKEHFRPDDFVGFAITGHPKKLKQLKKTAIPSLLLPVSNGVEDEVEMENDKITVDSLILNESMDEIRRDALKINEMEVNELSEELLDDTNAEQRVSLVEFGTQTDVLTVSHVEFGTQTDALTVSHVEFGTQTDASTVYSSAATQTTTRTKELSVQTEKSGLSIYDYSSEDKILHYFTGLETFNKIMFVFQTLGPARFCLNYVYTAPPKRMPVVDCFFMTLIYLRHFKTHYELGILFRLTEFQVKSILITWIRFMYLQWKEIDMFPARELVHFHAPKDFYNKYATTRLIVDGTEIPIHKPGLPKAQQSTFSTYKHKNTVKVLVGATPAGLVSYISAAYGGSTSDRQIVERSDLATRCDPGDNIMADKGFDVDDLLAPYKVHINIPTKFRKTNRISSNVLRRDRKIASKRVHIERIIGLAKTYKILRGPLKKDEIHLSDDIIFICFFLCNFRKRIVGDNA